VTVETSPTAVDLQQAKALHLQGNQKLASGNVAAARMFYRRAAEAGFADAAFALAATYDPEELVRLKVVGLKSDVAAARHWYERARGLGFKGAEERLVRLGAR
jgi:TPR repeat protein